MVVVFDMKIIDENVFFVVSRVRFEDVCEMMIFVLEGNFLKVREKLRDILLR